MRKFIRKKMGLFLSLIMVVCAINPMVAHAEENDNNEELIIDYVDSLDGVSEQALEVISVEELLHQDMLHENISSCISVSEGNCIGNFQTNGMSDISLCSSANSFTQSFTGTIDEEGEFSYLTVTLAPGEILQSTLLGPNDSAINYDLLLYSIVDNSFDSFIKGSTLSTYINTYADGSSKSVEDGISYINTSDTLQTYALIVIASEGCSTTEPFLLTVSIDEEGYYDAAEPNDSPFDAVMVTTGTIITNSNLNVTNDQDWYVWNVPSTISGTSITLSNSEYSVEVYRASGSSMILVNPDSSGVYNLNTGYYYIRVYCKNDDFNSSEYTLTFQPYGKIASRIVVSFNGDMGANKVTYPEGSYYRFRDTLYPSVLILDASGYPVISQTVTLTWLSGSWNESTGNSERSQTIITDNSGRGSFNMTVPTSLGYNSCLLSGAITFRHYYDIDGIVFQCGSASASQIVYHFSYSDYISS